jgi:hypothetical protein
LKNRENLKIEGRRDRTIEQNFGLVHEVSCCTVRPPFTSSVFFATKSEEDCFQLSEGFRLFAKLHTAQLNQLITKNSNGLFTFSATTTHGNKLSHNHMVCQSFGIGQEMKTPNFRYCISGDP